MRPFKSRAGFSLLELSLVLVVVSVAAAASMTLGTAMIESANKGSTNSKLTEIEVALNNYRIANNRLPCPADPALLPTDANFGIEAANPGSCTGGAPAAPFLDAANNAVEGAVPFITLGLPKGFMYDGWERKFAYAVNYLATAPRAMLGESLTDACGISLTDASDTAGSRSTGAVYALVSFGPDGHGGYLKNGTRLNAGVTNTDELTNCHCNSSGVATTYAASYVQKDMSLDASDAVNPFSDMVRFKERWQMMSTDDTYTNNGTRLCQQHIYVTDQLNRRVQKFSLSGYYLSQFGSAGAGNGQFGLAESIAIDSGGNLWVGDQSNRVQEFNSGGTYMSQFGSAGTANALTIDSGGNFWVVDYGSDVVNKFNSSGVYQSQFGSYGSGNGQFDVPGGIAIDASGNLWVTDENNNRVEEFNSSGTYMSQFGSAGSGNGQFSYPTGIAIDASGNLWVTEQGNHRVQEFNSSGTFLMGIGAGYNGVSGSIGSYGSGNGQFSGPQGITIDSGGNIWVADYGNNRVQEFNSSGTYLSQFGTSGSGNGQFNGPWDIAIH